MPHMRFLDDDSKNIRFTNYDKYEMFQDASYLRHKIEDEEDMGIFF